MQMSFAEAEAFGRQILLKGELTYLRETFTLSFSRLAGHLHTNTKTLKRWLGDPVRTATSVHSTTAARVGEFYQALDDLDKRYACDNVMVDQLYPLSLLAGEMGRSVSSPAFTRMCQTGEITCYDMGILGIYIPRTQVELLKGAK